MAVCLSKAETASVICNLTILPLTIFGGFMVRIPESSKWLSWIQHISFLKYGFIHGAYTIFGAVCCSGVTKQKNFRVAAITTDDHNIIATPTEPATSNALAHHFISGHQVRGNPTGRHLTARYTGFCVLSL